MGCLSDSNCSEILQRQNCSTGTQVIDDKFYGVIRWGMSVKWENCIHSFHTCTLMSIENKEYTRTFMW